MGKRKDFLLKILYNGKYVTKPLRYLNKGSKKKIYTYIQEKMFRRTGGKRTTKQGNKHDVYGNVHAAGKNKIKNKKREQQI